MRSVLITGTSSGIGLATAVVLASRGWRVFATMRNLEEERPARSVAEHRRRTRQSLLLRSSTLQVRPRSELQPTRYLALTGNALDAVVHNAGVAAAGALEDVPESEVRRVMETNFFGVLSLTRALLPTFRGQRRGRIVIVSSEAAFSGQPTNAIYCASKWAIEGWAEATAYELEPFGIAVVLVEPGPYRTAIWEGRPNSSRRAAPIGAGCSRCFVLPMHMPPQ